MAIKTREPGDAFKRQVAEYVPVKKRRPWRDEEEPSEETKGSNLQAGEVTSQREVQGATSDAILAPSSAVALTQLSDAVLALDDSKSKTSTSAESAPINQYSMEHKTSAVSALDMTSNLDLKSSAETALDWSSNLSGVEHRSDAVSAPDLCSEKILPKNDVIHFTQDKTLESGCKSSAETASDSDARMVSEPSAVSAPPKVLNGAVTSGAVSVPVEPVKFTQNIGANLALELSKEPALQSGAKLAPRGHRKTSVKSAPDLRGQTVSFASAKMAPDATGRVVEFDTDHAQHAETNDEYFGTEISKTNAFATSKIEPLPGNRKSRANFVFNVALRKIGQSSAGLLYCYLWHQAEEIGSAQLRITYSEMAEATGIGRRTLFESTKHLVDLGLFENINSGKTTTSLVRLKFGTFKKLG